MVQSKDDEYHALKASKAILNVYYLLEFENSE